MKPIQTERRLSKRYKLTLPAICTFPGSASPGILLNISGHGLLFQAEQPVAPDPSAIAELAIDWPAALDGCTPLKLVIGANLVRQSRQRFAFRIQRYEFRLRGKRIAA